MVFFLSTCLTVHTIRKTGGFYIGGFILQKNTKILSILGKKLFKNENFI